jgi:molybdopterin-containing oxidoreductase family membrane subunit
MRQANKWIVLAGIMMIIGLAGAVKILVVGEDAMGTSDWIPWGTMIAIYEFFAASSVGLTVIASLWYVFRLKPFEVIGRRALTLAIISLLCGFGAIGLELGNPLKMFWMLLTPNFSSGIFWMGALYSIYLGLLVLTLFYVFIGNEDRVKLLSKLTLVAAIAAVSNLGAVFGNLLARPFWHGPALPIYFIISALLSGAALLIIVFYLLEKKQAPAMGGESTIPLLGKMLALFAAMVMLFTFWKAVNGLYGGIPGKFEAAKALVAGPLSFNFWVMEVALGMVIPFMLIVTAKELKPVRAFYAAVLCLAGIFFMRYDLVASGQIVPLKVVEGAKEAVYYSYHTLWAEWAVLIGAIGLMLCLYLVAEEKLPLDGPIAGFAAKEAAKAAGVSK